MPMRITCPNCGKQFSAWDDLVGKAVECPKCHQKTVIAGKNEALEPPRAKSPAASPPAMRPAAPPAARSPGATRSSAPAASPKAPGPTPAPRRLTPPMPPPPSAPGKPAAKISPPAAQRPPTASPGLDDDDSLPLGCPNCNAQMSPNDDLCDACGYHLVLKKVIDISEMPKRNRSTGFERVFREQLHDPESSSSTLLIAKILGGLVVVGILFLCLGRLAVLAALVLAGVAAFWWWKQRQNAASDSGVNQDPISLVVWSTFLFVQRIIGWRRLQWPFSKTRSLILCDPEFDDRELRDLDRLSDLETLDLEGTGLTDEGLESLRSLKQLRFLVLRRTQVTSRGVQRLQEDLPRTWIWH